MRSTSLSLPILLLLWFSLATCAYVHLVTGRGTIEVSESGTLTETEYFCSDCEGQLWELKSDSRFPNGVFIHPKGSPNLVWDSKANQAVAGNPIILYAKKDTLVDTKNQRWQNTSADQFALIMNANFVAKVDFRIGYPTRLVLAAKNAADSYQKFTVIGESKLATVTVINSLNFHIKVEFDTPGGKLSGSITPESSGVFTVPIGSTVQAFNKNDMALIDRVNIASSSVQVNVPTPTSINLPLGTHQWVGWSNTDSSDPAHDSSLSLTFTLPDTLSGSGTDIRGAFDIYGGFEANGMVSFSKVYPGDVFIPCEGELDETGTILSGMWHLDNWEDYGQFKYLLDN